MTRYRGRRNKADKLQGVGFIVILATALIADGLFALEPLALSIAVLAVMVLLGGYLIHLGTSR